MLPAVPARSNVRLALLLALAAAALYAFAASRRDYWAPDEPDFAEHVREMNERREWVLPYENGVPYSEKPILFYWLIAATVGSALVGVVTFGTLAGSMLPFLLKRFGFDPASASAPFVATLVDVTGLIIYFTVALLILRGTLL